MRLDKITPETAIKEQVKDYLAFKGIFNYYILAGTATYKGLPDRVMHFKGRIVYLEIKSAKGVLSEAEREFQSQCEYDEVDYLVIRKIEDLINFIDKK